MKYVKKAGYIVATILFFVFTLGPFVWTFVMAITPKAEMFSNVVSLLPSHITWSKCCIFYRFEKFSSSSDCDDLYRYANCFGECIYIKQNGVSGKENYQKCLTYYDGHSGNGNYYSSV